MNSSYCCKYRVLCSADIRSQHPNENMQKRGAMLAKFACADVYASRKVIGVKHTLMQACVAAHSQ